MKSGQTSTVMCCERLLWKKVGHRKDCAISVGRTNISVKVAAKKKAQRSTYCSTAHAGRKSEARSQRIWRNGSKGKEHQRKTGSGKEESRCIP